MRDRLVGAGSLAFGGLEGETGSSVAHRKLEGTMMHAICATLVIALALAEMKAIRDWTHQHALISTQQAAAYSTLQPIYRISHQ
jgi:hypothetical protein